MNTHRQVIGVRLALLVSFIALFWLGCAGSEQATDTPVAPTSTATPVPVTDTPIPPTTTATPTMVARNLTNIDYSGGRLLDLYRPKEGSGPYPTVMVLHGPGDRKGAYTWLGEALSASGYAVVAPNWGPLGLAAENSLCALAWIHANAETYGFDPGRIATFGHSGGGTMAVLVAVIDDATEFLQECPHVLPESNAVDGAIAYAGSFFMPEWYLTQGWAGFKSLIEAEFRIPGEELENIHRALLDTPPEDWLDIVGSSREGTRLIHTLPPAWIDGSEPPILLIHGTADTLVDPIESQAFAELLKAEGVKVRMELIPGGKQAFGPPFPAFDEAWNATQAFLAEVLE